MALSAGADDIKALVKDPESFLKVNRLGFNLHRVFAKKALVKLVSVREKSYDLTFSETESKNTISAYVLGYKTNEANNALFLDIPSTGVEKGTFFFTAELSGCSVIVTRLKDGIYRVFHDFRSNSAVLYDNVVMCVDWDGYKIPGHVAEYGVFDPTKGRAVGHAVVCMQFKDGAWKLFLQRQLQGPFKLPDSVHWEMEVHLDVQSERSRNSSDLQTSFENRRRNMQRNIISRGKILGIDSAIIKGAVDRKYGGSGEFDENDASIRGWKELRDAMRLKLDKLEKQDMDAKGKSLMDHMWGKLKEIFAEKEDIDAKGMKGIDYLCGKCKDMLDAAQKLDRIWLWLQIKKATGKKGNDSTGGESSTQR